MKKPNPLRLVPKMKPQGRDKRQLERVPVHESVTVVDAMREMELGKMVNLHEEGFLLITNHEIKENSLFQLKFLFSEEIDGETEVGVGAECLWTLETDTGHQLWAGFHIMDLSEKGQLIITALKQRFPGS